MSLTAETRVVDLHVPEAGIIQDLEFLAVGRGKVCEILLVVSIHFFRIRFSLS